MSLQKTADFDAPHATYQGMGVFGHTEYRILKTYKKPASELKDPYARWMVAVKTDATFGGFDMGDSYKRDVLTDIKTMTRTKPQTNGSTLTASFRPPSPTTTRP